MGFVLAIDTETRGLHGVIHRLGAMTDRGDTLWLSKEEAKTSKTLARWLAQAEQIVVFNVKYDYPLMERDLDISMDWDRIIDPLLYGRLLLHEPEEKSLLSLSLHLLDYDGAEDVELEEWRVGHKVGHDYALIPDDVLKPYTMKQLENTLCLAYYFNCADCPTYSSELSLVRLMLKMEGRGIPINSRTLTRARTPLAAAYTQAEAKLFKLAGGPFSITSPAQVGKLIVARGIDLPLTPTGQPCTKADFLEPYADDPFVGTYSEAKKIQKLLSTYVEGLLKRTENDGCLHTSFSNTTTRTGRLSSSDPNLQNLAGKDASSSASFVRRAFKTRPGFTNYSFDYRGIQYRLSMYLSDDEAGITSLEAGVDPHIATAKILEVAERFVAKTVNYAVLFGMGVEALAKKLKITEEKAAGFLSVYFREHSGVSRFRNHLMSIARRTGTVTLSTGRTLFLRKSFCYKAFVYRMQGEEAEICKAAMLAVDKVLRGTGGAVLLQVHDELVVEFPTGRGVRRLRKAVADVMCGVPSPCPLDVDVERWRGNWANKVRVKGG